MNARSESTVGARGSDTELQSRLWAPRMMNEFACPIESRLMCRGNYYGTRNIHSNLSLSRRTYNEANEFPFIASIIISRDCYTSQHAYRSRRQNFYETYQRFCVSWLVEANFLTSTIIRCDRFSWTMKSTFDCVKCRPMYQVFSLPLAYTKQRTPHGIHHWQCG